MVAYHALTGCVFGCYLIGNEQPTTRHGNTQQVQDLYEYEEIVTENDDKSISMKRTFLVPGKVF